MAEIEGILFTPKEVVTALLKEQGIHEGIWALYIEFGLTAVNIPVNVGDPMSPPPADPKTALLPAAVVPLQRIGIVQANVVTNISVDAAEVNPKKGSQRPKQKKP